MNASPWIFLAVIILIALLPLTAQSEPNNETRRANAITPVTNTAKLMPRHGTVSIEPAKRWEDALAAGNGIMGALLYGDPRKDTIIADHCKLWLPLGSSEVVPDVGESLPHLRQIIGEQGYDAGHKFFLEKAKEAGWNGKLVWTDPFHPGFFLNIDQPADGPITDYARVENFATGEVWSQWRTTEGTFSHRMFVSRVNNVIVTRITGPLDKVTFSLKLQKIDNALIESKILYARNMITCHCVYVNGKGGFDCAIRLVTDGGKVKSSEDSISVIGTRSATLIMRIQPWKTPLKNTEAWPYSLKNPDFSRADQIAGLYRAAMTYNPLWMDDLKHEINALPASYNALLKPSAAAHNKIFGRVTVDLGGSRAERGMSSEALLDIAQKEHRMPAALLERMYDAGRYVFLCSAGTDTPPNLFGIWTGTWQPAWSGDYTLDTNLQLDIESAFSANMAECMQGYFHMFDSYLTDFRLNAQRLYGCRGIMTGSRASNNGLNLHWDQGWPGEFWTVGASWIAHWYYDYYQYTGDKTFLRDRAIPFMKGCALFWEDFLKGTEDATGRYTFRPSFSAENGWGDNSSQDIEITRELLTNLVRGCEILHVDQDGVKRWKTMLAKLPPLLINSDGQLKEWSNPTQGEHNNHRHLMHLYGAFECQQFSEEKDLKLFNAAKVALMNRIKFSAEDATHGFMQTALAADQLELGNEAYARLEKLATGRAIYPSMVDAHYPGPQVLCDDGNGATPEIIDRMLIRSDIGRLELLPAVPDALPKGTISGTRARGRIEVVRLRWDTLKGTITAVLISDIDQSIILTLPPNAIADRLTADRKPQTITVEGVRKQGCKLLLPKGKEVTIEARFHLTSQ
jgi:hypothetical protein